MTYWAVMLALQTLELSLVFHLVVVVRKACTRRPNYRVTSAPPSRLSLRKQKCLQWSTEFNKLSVWPLQFRRQAVPEPGAGSGETPVAETGTGPRHDACVHIGRMQMVAKLVTETCHLLVIKRWNYAMLCFTTLYELFQPNFYKYCHFCTVWLVSKHDEVSLAWIQNYKPDIWHMDHSHEQTAIIWQ